MPRDRYATDGSVEARYQPYSRGRVLANRVGIVRVRDMQQAESDALLALLSTLLDEVSDTQGFSSEDLRLWHRRWLGEIYLWAGQYRQVNIGKGGFQFASANLIPGLMTAFQREVLRRHTPCNDMDEPQLTRALAVSHAELILIHPFREGNGRLARLLNSLMAFQAGLPALDYGGIHGNAKHAYIAAIHAALDRNYAPMEKVFSSVIRRTLRRSHA